MIEIKELLKKSFIVFWSSLMYIEAQICYLVEELLIFAKYVPE
jgi:hypothetical protein